MPVLETPKPDAFRYGWYRFLGLLTHPRRLVNFLKYRSSKFKSRISHYPLMMDIEPTQRCNYRCIMCDPASLFHERRKDMTFEQFKGVLDAQYGLMEVKIQGVGEPLLNKDFMKMVHYALGLRLWVRTTLNGSLLHKDDVYKDLVDSGLHDLNISCDGASKETYEKIRAGGDFETFKRNSLLLNEYNASRGNPLPVRAWVVVQEENKHEFLRFPAFFASLGYREMCLSFAMHNYGRDEENPNATDFRGTPEDFEAVMAEGLRHGIAVKFWSFPRMTREAFCKIPFNRVYLTTDLHIVPCCYIANQEIVDGGEYADFDQIWFGNYEKFRTTHNDPKQRLMPYCENCYHKNGCEK